MPLLCGYCNREFASRDALSRHAQAKHRNPQCGVCFQLFSDQHALDQHTRAKHYHPCHYCDSVYEDEDDLEVHLENWHQTFDCDLCNRQFDSERSLKQHNEAKHSLFTTCRRCNKTVYTQGFQQHWQAKHTFPCTDCAEVFSYKDGLDDHREVAHRTLHPCPYCPKAFWDAALLDHHDAEEHTFECNDCDEVFWYEGGLIAHRVVEHPTVFSCPHCPKAFFSTDSLEQHDAAKHTFECNDCDDVYIDKDGLNLHRALAHPTDFPCPYCPKVFKSATSLEQHDAAKHTFECRGCYLVYASEEVMEEHYAEEHLVHECDWCDRKFAREDSKSSHERAKHLYCFMCRREFSTAQGKLAHDRAKHTFVCPFLGCYSEFRTPELVRIHEKTMHTTGYECCECSLRYGTETELDFHMKSLHTNTIARKVADNLTCEICFERFNTERSLEQHKESPRHKPSTPGLVCFGKGCGKEFASPSAMIMHLESGACASGTTKIEVDEVVAENDRAGVITNQPIVHRGRLDFGTVEKMEYGEDEVLDSCADTPVSTIQSGRSSPESTTVTAAESNSLVPYSPAEESPSFPVSEIVTPKSDSSSYFDADLLHTSLLGIDGVTFDDYIYRCPPPSYFGIVDDALHERRFRSLSALAQHIEVGACAKQKGLFKAALRFMESTLASEKLNGHFVRYLKEY